MLIFVDLGHQVCPDCDPPDPGCKGRFAFWNTVYDQFIDLDGEQAWDSWALFEEAYCIEVQKGIAGERPPHLDRFLRLYQAHRDSQEVS